MTLLEFVSKYKNKFVEYHSYGTGAINQCIDLVNQYFVEVLNVSAVIGTNAVDVPSKVKDTDFTWIPNTPTAVPEKGDVIVFKGIIGHISIFYEGDVNNFVSFDQNWPTGSPCQLVGHDYTNVLGWLHPLQNTMSNTMSIAKNTFERLVKKSTQWDGIVEYLMPDANPDNTTAEQLKSVVAGLKSRITDMEKQASEAKSELANRIEQVGRLKDEIANINNLLSDTNIRLNNATKEYQKLLGEYKGQLAEKQDQVDTLAKSLGEARNQIAELNLKREYIILLSLGMFKLVREVK